jgi:hypothetical protein
MSNYAVYDLETKKGIPSPVTTGKMEVCGGWSDYKNMGISIASITFEEKRAESWVLVTKSFLNIDEFYREVAKLQSLNYLVGGFNTKSFDDKLLREHGYPFSSDFDILTLVKQAAGVKPFQKGLSYSLDFISKANGLAKLGDGAFAPLLFQQNRIKELTLYAEMDSYIEYQILKLLLTGKLVDPNNGNLLKL